MNALFLSQPGWHAAAVAVAVPDRAAGPISTRVSSAPAAPNIQNYYRSSVTKKKSKNIQQPSTCSANCCFASTQRYLFRSGNRWTNLEQQQVVLLLSLLDHRDEPHDNVDTEARSRSPAASIPSIPSQGRNSDFRANRRSIHSSIQVE